MVGLKTIFKIVKAVGTTGKLVGAVVMLDKIRKMVPPSATKKISSAYNEMKVKSREGMLHVLETHSPGLVDELVQRKGGKPATKEDLEALIKQITTQNNQNQTATPKNT